jgi:hypothetical protein
MVDFLQIYSEAGMIGVVGALFVFMIYNNVKDRRIQGQALEDLKIENKGQSETLENMEGMVIKLIERWNRSDETRDRRHENLVKEIDDMSDILNRMDGALSRMNGRNG